MARDQGSSRPLVAANDALGNPLSATYSCSAAASGRSRVAARLLVGLLASASSLPELVWRVGHSPLRLSSASGQVQKRTVAPCRLAELSAARLAMPRHKMTDH